MEPEIVQADATEAGQLADLIGGAFAELPPTEWLVPVAAERPRVLADSFRIYVDFAIKHGEVHVTTDRTGVAIWFPRNKALPEPDDYDTRLAEACGPWTDRFRALDELFEANHPAEPHHHLAFLATQHDRRGRGVGSALLRHHHTYLDESALPAYLEASQPRSRDLYLRHGYGLRGEPFKLPSGAPFWPMWRPAQAAASRLRAS